MKVTRFVQFNLGEGLEKKSQDFAAEVATQIVAKPVISPVKEEPAAVEAKETGISEKFKKLVDDLAMQVAACPQVQFVSIEDIPETIVTKEKDLEMQREDLALKPENIREKIV
ncbi:elongation factor Ts [Medicago truncatula]|nr:elongation factor Ts-like [Medicago truncatula]